MDTYVCTSNTSIVQEIAACWRLVNTILKKSPTPSSSHS